MVSLTGSVRTVVLPDGTSQQRTVDLLPSEEPWIFAAQRHIDWLSVRLRS
jgi:hypothetical protein